MAWQLHYTSVAAGPTGRAGFQFVAETPGLPPGVRSRIAPLLAYRPPPNAPLAPTNQEISCFPVALTYDLLGSHRVLTRCVYLGRDYSGRYGNFLGHALVVSPDELTGLRPVELWEAPFWKDSPDAALPALTEIVPGAATDPESLGEWLAQQGDGGYARLGLLLETTLRSLAGAHERLVLVAGDVEEIVRWITVISYSLPWTVALGLSFTTYSADPATAPQTIVGTTPDVWLPSDLDAEVIDLAGPVTATGTGRLARTVVDCWRRMDMAALDGMAELGRTDPEAAAALVALCDGDPTVTRAEQLAVARLLGAGLPARVWRALENAADRMEYELAAAASVTGPPETADRYAARCVALALRDPGLPLPAVRLRAAARQALEPRVRAALGEAASLTGLADVTRLVVEAGLAVPGHDLERGAAALVRAGAADLLRAVGRMPYDLRGRLVAGVLAGLETASARVRARLLTDEVCDLLAPADLARAPRTGAAVVHSLVRRDALGRIDATERLVRLAPEPGRDTVLREIWAGPPTAAECGALAERLGTSVGVSPVLTELPGRAFLAEGPRKETAGLARLVTARAPVGSAELVVAVAEITGAPRPRDLAGPLERLLDAGETVTPDLRGAVAKAVLEVLDSRRPEFLAKVVLTASRRAAAWLVDLWLGRVRSREEQARLLEVAIRLRMNGTPSERLDAWARESPLGSMRSRFARDPELLRGYEELVRPRTALWDRVRPRPMWKRK
ncbi:GAP1-N2 domain-containing protein [Streptosporangium saharense]|uniref:GAP1-N2 domain-containing protein n=1 Tax=Streptosporangium saharense TaxID=1706840 RepID=UPI0036908580